MLTHRLLRSAVSHLCEPALPSVWHQYEAHGTPCHTFQREKDFISWSRKKPSAEKLSRHDCFVSNLRFILFHISVKMADDLGPMAWSFLPENEQVQYLQKIALRAENPSGPNMNPKIHEKKTKRTKNEGRALFSAKHIFCCLLEAAHFPAKSPLLERETRPFSQEISKID